MKNQKNRFNLNQPNVVRHFCRVKEEKFSGIFRRQFLWVLMIICLSVLSTPSNAISLNAVATGAISGRVTGPDGVTPLQSVYTVAYTWNCSYWEWSGSAYTDADGNYEINELASGIYRVEFADDWSGEYATECYNNKSSLDLADDIPVTAGQTVTGIDASLALGGHITGRVTGPDGVTPAQSVYAEAYIWNTSNSSWDSRGYGYTDADGNYDIGGLSSGAYRVKFMDWYDAYVQECYNDKSSLDLADDILVTAGQAVTGINASLALAPGGHITGRVTGPDGVTPAQSVDLEVYIWNGSYWGYTGYGYTDANGDYAINGLASGTYRLEFSDWSGDYAGEFYNNKSSLDLADDILVTAGQTVTGINASLSLAGHITGRVTGPDGVTPLRCVQATAYTWNGYYWDRNWMVDDTYTDADGNYDIGGLTSGTYRVEFHDTDTLRLYVDEYYNNKSSLDLADDILVTAGQTVPGIDASMAPAGQLAELTTVQKLFIGYYLRPAAPAGLVYWAGRWAEEEAKPDGSIKNVIEAFANTPESQAIWGGITEANIEEFINKAFQALFGRDAAPYGLNFYHTGYTNGDFTPGTIVYDIFVGAPEGSHDKAVLDKKLAFANAFTSILEQTPDANPENDQATYSGQIDAAIARDILAAVGEFTVIDPAAIKQQIMDQIADPGDPILH